MIFFFRLLSINLACIGQTIAKVKIKQLKEQKCRTALLSSIIFRFASPNQTNLQIHSMYLPYPHITFKSIGCLLPSKSFQLACYSNSLWFKTREWQRSECSLTLSFPLIFHSNVFNGCDNKNVPMQTSNINQAKSFRQNFRLSL